MKLFPNRVAPLRLTLRSLGILLLAASCQLNLAAPGADISGVWSAVSTASDGKLYRGELHIVQRGTDIEAVSTTGKSAWQGTLTGRTLRANWRRSDDAGQLTLTLSADGRSLAGKWSSPKGAGTYKATKTRSGGQY
jgi:hypothetical protein